MHSVTGKRRGGVYSLRVIFGLSSSRSQSANRLILAQTGCYCKFNIEAQKCFCLFLPAAIAVGKKIQATRFAGGLLTPTTSSTRAAPGNRIIHQVFLCR